jgi:PAS domain S-box-containing protein
MTTLTKPDPRPGDRPWRPFLHRAPLCVLLPAALITLCRVAMLSSGLGDFLRILLMIPVLLLVLSWIAWREVAVQQQTEAALRRENEALLRITAEVERQVAERTVELTNATRRLAVSEARYRTLVDTASEIIWTTDPEGRVIEPLPSWQAFTGQGDGEILGDGWAGAVHPDDAAVLQTRWNLCVSARAVGRCEARVRRRDGAYRQLKTLAVPVLTEAGEIREWIGMSNDVTDRRAAEKEAAELKLKLSSRVSELEKAMGSIRTLQGLLPVCSYCKKVRDDQDYWHQLDQYIITHTDTQVSHGICPECYDREIEPELKALPGSA